MKLHTLVQNANQTYGLGLDASGAQDLCKRLQRSGFGKEVSASAAGRVLDTILSFTDDVDDEPVSVYASLKIEAAMPTTADDACPRCKDQMRSVLLVGNRKASYCQPCAITLPLKVEG